MFKFIKIVFCFTALFSLKISNAQILENFISKSMALRGGKEKIQNFQTLMIEGEIKIGTQKTPIVIYIRHVEGYKHEYTINGKKEILIVNKNESWKGESISTLVKNEDYIHQTLLTYMDIKGDFMDMDVSSKYEFIDFESINNVEYMKINKIEMAKNTTKMLYYSNNDFMKYKESFVNLSNGKDENYTYSNYKKTDYGLMMPFSFNIGFGEITVLKYTFNKMFDKLLFLPELEAENISNKKTPVQAKERK
jgi:hypothetical protein